MLASCRSGVEADLRRVRLRPAEGSGARAASGRSRLLCCLRLCTAADGAACEQELESILVGPIPLGLNKIVFQVRAISYPPALVPLAALSALGLAFIGLPSPPLARNSDRCPEHGADRGKGHPRPDCDPAHVQLHGAGVYSDRCATPFPPRRTLAVAD